ncbi:putative fucosyltransferase 8 [Senna tora]|uniref:Putative fucosyltransferase 8 n=1 Tax=Senna tora TaxID=362788 RepID=A0A834TCF1_9FABA|nr:putative fucosyltransferase 8 [Senna tora]
MYFFEVTVEKIRLCFNRFRTPSVILGIAFVILCLITYKDSISNHLEGFSKDKVFGGTVQNVAYESLGPRVQPSIGSNSVSKNDSFTNSKHDSFTNSTKNSFRNSTKDSFTNSTKDSFTNSTKDSSPPTRNSPIADKLLDGLLAFGFDEASSSCLSRFESYLYQKASSPHKPSSYLISKLRKYEDLHKLCGPHTSLYNITMAELTRTSTRKHGASTSTMCSYIVWTPANGLGNRMVSMASAFLYALLTDRVLMVEFGSDMDGLFCEPFPNSSWRLPSDFPLSELEKHIETYQKMVNKDRENSSSSRHISSPLVLHLNLQHSSEDPEKFFHCDHSQALLHEVPMLILRSDQYFVPSLFLTPSFRQELSKMFPEKDTVFHHLGRYLFLPSNEIWGKICRFYQAYMEKADERIGLQIRVFSPDRTPNEVIMDQILRCTLKNKVLPDLGTRDDSLTTNSSLKNQTLKSVLVTSLHSYYGENLRTMYLTKPTVSGEIVGVFQPSHEENQKFNDNRHNMRALIEIYLLSLCDVLVTSSVSSFGYVAQSLGALKPWVLHKLLDKNIPDPPCVLDFSIEPCFHSPPKHDCLGKPMDHDGKDFPYARPCVDFDFGMKMLLSKNNQCKEDKFKGEEKGCPHNLFPDNTKYLNEEQPLHKDFGISPEKWFLLKSKISKLDMFPNDVETPPSNPFPERFRYCKLIKGRGSRSASAVIGSTKGPVKEL